MSEATVPRLYAGGGSDVRPRPGGSLRLELWTHEQQAGEGPAIFEMSPGQALVLIQQLAKAAQRSLTENLQP